MRKKIQIQKGFFKATLDREISVQANDNRCDKESLELVHPLRIQEYIA